MFRGIKNISDIGHVVEYQEETELDTYDGEECNEFKGTDGLFFPPFLNTNMKIWAFAAPICRSLATWFEEKSSYKKVALSRYVTHFNVIFFFIRNKKNNSLKIFFAVLEYI